MALCHFMFWGLKVGIQAGVPIGPDQITPIISQIMGGNMENLNVCDKIDWEWAGGNNATVSRFLV